MIYTGILSATQTGGPEYNQHLIDRFSHCVQYSYISLLPLTCNTSQQYEPLFHHWPRVFLAIGLLLKILHKSDLVVQTITKIYFKCFTGKWPLALVWWYSMVQVCSLKIIAIDPDYLSLCLEMTAYFLSYLTWWFILTWPLTLFLQALFSGLTII